MKRNLLLLFVVVGLLLAGCTEIRLDGPVTAAENETQSVVVTGVPTVTISNFAGTITVRNGEAGKVTGNLTRQSRATDEAEAQAQLDSITMEISQTNNNVEMTVDAPHNTDNLQAGLTAELEVLVPPGSTLSLNLGAGDITVEEPAADVAYNLGAGTATTVLPADASFNVSISGGVTGVDSDFPEVSGGGLATDMDVTVGANPTQTLTFNVGAGEVNLRQK